MKKAKGAAKLSARIAVSKAKVEIYGDKQLKSLKAVVTRLTAAKKKKTFPVLEKQLADAQAIYAAAKAHFSSGSYRKVQRDLTRIARRRGCRQVVSRIRYFHGRRVPKTKVVRRIVRH